MSRMKAFPPLGGLAPRAFLQSYWQKKPLLIRGAFPGFTGLLDKAALFEAACRDDVESRLVARKGERWELDHGPFLPSRFRRRRDCWTLLVQGLNLFLPEADRLLREFAFIPYARLDDVMVSYAVDGGGVGPHVDNYDVFLLQGMGRRRWGIASPGRHAMRSDQPLKLLKDFRAEQEWVLEPGDMLYLPPEWAHEGTAIGECMTYSIGFRAAPIQELAESFLDFLRDRLELSGRYRDPGLLLQKHPAEISAQMVDQIAAAMNGIRWTRATVRDFLGSHLTEPKLQVIFEPPQAPLARSRFLKAAMRRGVRLDPRTQLLFTGSRFYLNGDILAGLPASSRAALRQLADTRELVELAALDIGTLDTIYRWYRDGFLDLR